MNKLVQVSYIHKTYTFRLLLKAGVAHEISRTTPRSFFYLTSVIRFVNTRDPAESR